MILRHLRTSLTSASLASKSFSTTSVVSAFVSHIGREPIKFPESVTLTPSSSPSPPSSSSSSSSTTSIDASSSTPTALTIKGPLGTTSVPLRPYMSLTFTHPDTLALAVENPAVKEQRAMWGTTRTLIANAITGMSEGFTVPLYLVGVGYRAALEDDPRGAVTGTAGSADKDATSGKRLNMKLGYSHSVLVPVPAHIKAEVPSPTKIVLSCTDKHLLGLFAAKVRSFRKPEPYKGKGIFIGNEQVRIKSVKKK